MSEQVTIHQQPTAYGSQDVESVIGPSLVIKGEVAAEQGLLLIMGRVEGQIDLNESLTVHADGSVKATIKVKEIQIDGTADGDIYGSNSVSISDTAKVKGNIFTPRISIAEGAHFNGSIDMDAPSEVPKKTATKLTDQSDQKH